MVATASEFARQLPPGSRDFEAYRLMAVEGLSTREAAAAMRLSQTRVIQLRDRVVDWIAVELPRLETHPPEQRLLAAEYLAVERMEFLYGTSLKAWRQSQGTETVERRSGVTGDTSTVVRTSHGNVRYLQQAMRIAKEMGKLPRRSLPMAVDEADEEEVVYESVVPLKGDCSAPEHVRLHVNESGDESFDARSSASDVYDDRESENEAANRVRYRENGPVQSAAGCDSGGSEMVVSAPPLNRQQRRARKRRLETALKRRSR